MASHAPPKKNTAYVTYVGLISQSSGKLFQSNPTLAAGDVKVSIDGGAFNNLATLPVVTPAAGKAVKVDLSSSEMNGDEIVVLFSDAAGAEWNDLMITLHTSARLFDDLMFPTVSGRSADVSTTGEVGLDFDNVKAASAPTTLTNITVPTVTSLTNDAGITQAGADKVWGTASRTLTAFGFSVTVGTNNDKTGYALSAAGVQAIWDALSTALTTAGSIGKRLVDFITGDAFARLGAPANASVSADIAAVKAETAAIKAKTDNLPADPADESNTQARFTTIDTNLATLTGFVDTEVAAIKAKTDNLPAAPAAVGDIPTAVQNADALLNRDMSAVTDSVARSPLNALRFLRNKKDAETTPGTLVVFKENDTTVAWNAALTTDPSAQPVTIVDPT